MYFKQKSLKWEGAPRSMPREQRWYRNGHTSGLLTELGIKRGLLTDGHLLQFSVAPEGVFVSSQSTFRWSLIVCGLFLSDCQRVILLKGEACHPHRSGTPDENGERNH